MTFLQESLARFLQNLTPSMEKGFILQLRLNDLNLPNVSENISEVKKLFQTAQKSKKCQLLYSFESNVFFIYFPGSPAAPRSPAGCQRRQCRTCRNTKDPPRPPDAR